MAGRYDHVFANLQPAVIAALGGIKVAYDRIHNRYYSDDGLPTNLNSPAVQADSRESTTPSTRPTWQQRIAPGPTRRLIAPPPPTPTPSDERAPGWVPVGATRFKARYNSRGKRIGYRYYRADGSKVYGGKWHPKFQQGTRKNLDPTPRARSRSRSRSPYLPPASTSTSTAQPEGRCCPWCDEHCQGNHPSYRPRKVLKGYSWMKPGRTVPPSFLRRNLRRPSFIHRRYKRRHPYIRFNV